MKVKEVAVLFVEDEPFLRESMGAWLARTAGQVLCAENGEKAMEILAANKIDLLITDVRMPGMDGIALVKRVGKAELGPRMIIVTGFNDLSLQEARRLGIDAILEKPIDREELLRAMKNCLGDGDGDA